MGKDLVGEGVGYDERGVISGIVKVDEMIFGEEDDVVVGGYGEVVDLGFDVLDGFGVFFELGNVDFNVEVINVWNFG